MLEPPNKRIPMANPLGSSRRFWRSVLFLGTALLAIATVSPLVWMISAAFKGSNETFSPNLIPSRPTFANFQYVFTQLPFFRYMFNSFFVSGTVTIIALFFHSMAAFALARLKFPGRDTIFLVIFSTFLVSLPVIIVP